MPPRAPTTAGLAWVERPDWKDETIIALGIPDNSALYAVREVEVGTARSVEIGLGSDDGVQVWLGAERVHANSASRGAAPNQDKISVALPAGRSRLVVKVSNVGGPSGLWFRLGESATPVELRGLVERAADGGLAALGAEERGRLIEYFATSVHPGRRQVDEEIRRVEEEERALRASRPTSMVLEDQEIARPTYILERGNYAAPIRDEVLDPGVPARLPPLAADATPNRLGLARWMVDPDHPLTSRVQVNRLWLALFGQGIVRTSEDFGARGDPPSHPELLDWLAREFTDSGWDVKRLLRRILLSAAFRRSSVFVPEHTARDPENALLARGPRYRLTGEFIRDQALAAAGLVHDPIGGPSTKTYQPPNIWSEVSLDPGLVYEQDRAEKLYRRSMYIYWKRSAPSPSMTSFDAPTREQCIVRRQVTNTPLQALVTLNDVQFVEAARVFAARILREGGAEFDARVDLAFLVASARRPDALRRAAVRELWEEQLAVFRAHPDRAEALLGFGEYPRAPDLDPAEHATWTLIASVILNLDEVLTQE
jgi:hypothetical protein